MEIYTPAAYHKPHPCWLPMIPTEETLKAHIEKLDLYIVSHGGVGSVYLTEYLESKGVNVRNNNVHRLWGYAAHYPYQLSENTPTLYVYGDIKNSLISQYKRDWLAGNARKMHFGIKKEKIDTLKHFLDTFPSDPIGVWGQYHNWENAKNTLRIKYPWTKKDIKDALSQFSIEVFLDDFEIKRRETDDSYVVTDPVLAKILSVYKGFPPASHD